ncbi:MAG: hypothetical protein ACI9YB_002376 [Halioglobus sp.]
MGLLICSSKFGTSVGSPTRLSVKEEAMISRVDSFMAKCSFLHSRRLRNPDSKVK